MAKQAGKEAPARRRRLARGSHLLLQLRNPALGVGERVFLHQDGLSEQIRRAGLRGNSLVDELFGLRIVRLGIGAPQPAE